MSVLVLLGLPSRSLLLNEIAILALFALSLDLVLGYAGIVSLGHAAFFGTGAYVAGLLTKHGIADPTLGLLVAAAASAALGFATSFLVLRGSDLTRLMVTLGVALVLFEIANQWAAITGGADGLQGVAPGPVLGLFAFDIFGRTASIYSLAILFLMFLLARRIVNSPFGLSLQRDPRQSVARRGGRHSGRGEARRHLCDRGGLCRGRRGLARANHAIRFARRVRFCALGRRPSRAHHRRHGLSLRRLARRLRLQGDARRFRRDHSAALAILDRLRPRRARAGAARAARARRRIVAFASLPRASASISTKQG